MNLIHASFSALNPLAVFAAAVAITIVGILWYSQPLFGRAFIRLSGIRPGDIRPEHVRRTAIVGFITALIYAALLSMIHHLELYWLDHVVCIQAPCPPVPMQIKPNQLLFTSIIVIWFFIMLTQLNGFLFRREPFALFLLTTLRSLITLMAGGLVLTFWS